ncbi:MAG: DegT/DnrJ/EryC1/StrS family aminotransferase [Ruminococcus sp.]|nr:DegT/DnrJ/EryC1/StrS family aminotransferase [Candidatus Copronaster equi]
MSDPILVTRSSMPELDEYVKEIRELWDSHWLTNMGVKHETFRNELKKYLGIENIELLTNGHMALELTIQAMGLTGEIITTPFTFASTTHSIIRNNITPVFCDINKDDYTIDADKIESLITEKTSAILPVHVYGNICDVEKIQKIADKYNLKVIYDAAHTFGETYKGKSVAEYGDASCFSFHATKVFNTIEGGAVCFSDKKLGETLYDLKNFGIHGQDCVSAVGANAKMNEFCAAMGICNLRHLDDEIAKRKNAYDLYCECLSDVNGIKLNYFNSDVKSNYAYFPIVVDKEKFGQNRDELMETLQKENIYSRKYFYPITNTFDCFNGKFDVNETPVALEISKNVLTLPIYSDLTEENINRICDIITK